MSQAPMMPIYPDALLGDTLHLSAEQLGAYLLLLFATWRNNGKPLADDDRKLARICRSTTAHWRRALRPTVIEFFQTDDGFLSLIHISEPTRLLSISYAVFCLKKKKTITN